MARTCIYAVVWLNQPRPVADPGFQVRGGGWNFKHAFPVPPASEASRGLACPGVCSPKNVCNACKWMQNCYSMWFKPVWLQFLLLAWTSLIKLSPFNWSPMTWNITDYQQIKEVQRTLYHEQTFQHNSQRMAKSYKWSVISITYIWHAEPFRCQGEVHTTFLSISHTSHDIMQVMQQMPTPSIFPFHPMCIPVHEHIHYYTA